MVYKLRRAKISFLPLEKVVLIGDYSKCLTYSKHVIFMSEWIDQFQCVNEKVCSHLSLSLWKCIFLDQAPLFLKVCTHRLHHLKLQNQNCWNGLSWVLQSLRVICWIITKTQNILCCKEPTKIFKLNSSVNGNTGIIMGDFLQISL